MKQIVTNLVIQLHDAHIYQELPPLAAIDTGQSSPWVVSMNTNNTQQ